MTRHVGRHGRPVGDEVGVSESVPSEARRHPAPPHPVAVGGPAPTGPAPVWPLTAPQRDGMLGGQPGGRARAEVLTFYTRSHPPWAEHGVNPAPHAGVSARTILEAVVLALPGTLEAMQAAAEPAVSWLGSGGHGVADLPSSHRPSPVRQDSAPDCEVDASPHIPRGCVVVLVRRNTIQRTGKLSDIMTAFSVLRSRLTGTPDHSRRRQTVKQSNSQALGLLRRRNQDTASTISSSTLDATPAQPFGPPGGRNRQCLRPHARAPPQEGRRVRRADLVPRGLARRALLHRCGARRPGAIRGGHAAQRPRGPGTRGDFDEAATHFEESGATGQVADAR
jgi:hypothetical protein